MDATAQTSASGVHQVHQVHQVHPGVSKNRGGPPKSQIIHFNRVFWFSIINHPSTVGSLEPCWRPRALVPQNLWLHRWSVVSAVSGLTASKGRRACRPTLVMCRAGVRLRHLRVFLGKKSQAEKNIPQVQGKILCIGRTLPTFIQIVKYFQACKHPTP